MASPSTISVSLANLDVFTPFYPWMEMMCRENAKPGQGKMIFPEMAFDIKGLDSEKEYQVSLSIERFGNQKYTYKENSKEWKVSGKAAEEHEYKKLSKKKSESGATWMKEPLTFPEARITNKPGNEKEGTFYTASLQKYVPVVYIRDVETSEEHRFEVEKAQFVATVKIYNEGLGSWKAAKNPYSTRKNNGPGRRKRKAEEHGNEAPMAKRTPLQEQRTQEFNWNAPNFLEHQPAASTLQPTYSSQYINPHFNYQAAPGFNYGYPSTSNINYGYNYPSAPFNTSTNYHPGYYGHQQHQLNYNFQYHQYHQYPSNPMTNLAPTVHDNSTPKPISSTPTQSSNTQLHDENSNFIQMYLGQDLH